MLKKRVLTACILLPLIILAILYLNIESFAVLTAIIFLIGAWEWTSLSGFKTIPERVLAFIIFPLLALLFFILVKYLMFAVLIYINQPNLFFHLLGIISLISWCLAAVAVFLYPKGSSIYGKKWISLIIGVFVLVPSWFALVILQYLNGYYLFYILALIFAADTSAYFVGRKFGKHKLAPNVSPGKTWEGVLGAVTAAILVSMIGFAIIKPHHKLFIWGFIAVMVVLFSIIGDLFESLFKRLRGLKDSGTILPGHGGILDRLDSLTAALPIFALVFN